ncbi:MAG: hypothetical protein QOH71_990 [Blastocatellia bacterium]|jgi:hypothetical protein|nr:hypothetical protein [Blastocatellia bacterium]
MTNTCQELKVAHSSRTFSLFFAGLGLVFLLSALVGCDRGVPDWHDISKAEPSPSPTPSAISIKTTNELVVYLDESGSMAGYVTRDGQTIFGKALRELRYATGTFAASDVRVLVRHVGADVGPPLPDMDLTTASQDPSVYRAGETNLAGAINSFKVGYQNPGSAQRKAAPQGDGNADPPDSPPARFQILVTDGVQSTKRGNSIQDCTAGSDQFCVRQKIGELLKAGWAGCVLGVRADFHGKVYSEVSGAGIPYETKSNDPSSFRPFYFYVFSPDPAALDSLVRSLKERLRPLLTNCSECLRELNLSFPYTDGFADFEVLIPKESRDAVQKTKNPGGPPPRFTIRVDVNTERSGPKPLTIQIKVPWSKHAIDAGNEQELMQLLTWEVVPFYPAGQTKERVRFPEIKITGTHYEAGQLVLDATTSFPPGTEKPSWRVYRLEGRVNLNQATPSWIRAWSTDLDTKREVANKTFNLETALLGLWNNSTAKDQVVAKAYLRIGP